MQADRRSRLAGLIMVVFKYNGGRIIQRLTSSSNEE